MKQDKAQQAARDEKLVPTEDRVKIVKSNLRMDLALTQKEETYQQFWFTIKKVNKSSFYQFDIDNKTCQIDVELFQNILDICPRVQNQAFTVPPSHDSLMDFLLDLGYKGPLKHIFEMFVDHMHQPWRNLGAIINRCLSGKTLTTDNQRLEDVRSCPIPGSLKPSYTTSCLNTNQFPRDKIGRGKGAQVTKVVVIPKKVTSAFKKKKQKKKVSIRNESSDEESEEQEERLVRQPKGVVIQDTLQVSKKKSIDPSRKLKLKGIKFLSNAAQLEIDTQKAIKASRHESRFQHQSSGLSEGAGLGPEVLDEPTGKSAVLDEGAGTSPEVLDKTKDKSEAQYDLEYWGFTDDETFLFEDKEENPEDIPWVSTDDDESENDDEEDDASINIDKTDDDRTDTDIEDQVNGVAEINIAKEVEEENSERVEEQKDDEELKADEEQKGDDQAGDEQLVVPVSTT
ncbi:hypothetical protein Tco_1416163 [Tanacetum coccineum]